MGTAGRIRHEELEQSLKLMRDIHGLGRRFSEVLVCPEPLVFNTSKQTPVQVTILCDDAAA